MIRLCHTFADPCHPGLWLLAHAQSITLRHSLDLRHAIDMEKLKCIELLNHRVFSIITSASASCF